jgi:hypothetical protein
VQVILEDDIDGGQASETVEFALDGTTYEIDLSEENAAKLRDAFALYRTHGRKLGSSRRGGAGSGRTRARTGTGNGPAASEIREWARSNGMTVPERGRVSAEVRQAYDAAH